MVVEGECFASQTDQAGLLKPELTKNNLRCISIIGLTYSFSFLLLSTVTLICIS